MSRILFLNGNAHGHINPTLPVVEELVHRGNTVVYFSTEEFRERIVAAGAEFMDYGKELYEFFKNYRPCGTHPFYALIDFMLKMDRVVVPLVLDRIANMEFDLLIHDSMFGGGRIVARKLKLKAVCSCTSFAMNRPPLPPHMLEPGFHPELDKLYEDLTEAQKDWDINSLKPMDIFFKKEDLNIVFTSRMFQPDSGSFDDSFKFVGPSISSRDEIPDFSLENPNNQPTVYISMGTINNNCLDFYRMCFEAFNGTKHRIIMSIGNKAAISELGKIPDNFVVRNYVPQLEVLKKTDVFISHGGLNSVSEALYYGVPVVAIPQANDQPMVARQLVNLGAGKCLDKNTVTSELLRNSVEEVLLNISFKRSSMELGNSFHQAGGYMTAVDYIINKVDA